MSLNCYEISTYKKKWFYQNGLIQKVLEDIGMNNCNGMSISTKVEAPLGEYQNVPESKRDQPNLYVSFIGTMFYPASSTIPDI